MRWPRERPGASSQTDIHSVQRACFWLWKSLWTVDPKMLNHWFFPVALLSRKNVHPLPVWNHSRQDGLKLSNTCSWLKFPSNLPASLSHSSVVFWPTGSYSTKVQKAQSTPPTEHQTAERHGDRLERSQLKYRLKIHTVFSVVGEAETQ